MHIETKCAITCRATICNLFEFVCKVSNDKIYNFFLFEILNGYLSKSNESYMVLQYATLEENWKTIRYKSYLHEGVRKAVSISATS